MGCLFPIFLQDYHIRYRKAVPPEVIRAVDIEVSINAFQVLPRGERGSVDRLIVGPVNGKTGSLQILSALKAVWVKFLPLF